MGRKTVGVSPKAPAAGVGAAAATLVAAVLVELFDTKLDVSTAQAIGGLVVAAIGAIAGAYLAKPGQVVPTANNNPGRRSGEAGYSVIELAVGLVVFIILVILLLELIDRV